MDPGLRRDDNKRMSMRNKNENMTKHRKTIVCIFAHPDDEAFGPGGTIAQMAREADVYIICATKGEAGNTKACASGETPLEHMRAGELEASGKILGVKEVFFLGFRDGELCNNKYHEIAEKVEEILQKLKSEEIITFEPLGVSGHIDHVAIAMVSSFVFQRLDYIKKIWYFCISEEMVARHDPYFIYIPPGYKPTEVDIINDVSNVWDVKIKAMREHKSQSDDAAMLLNTMGDLMKQELFLIREKK